MGPRDMTNLGGPRVDETAATADDGVFRGARVKARAAALDLLADAATLVTPLRGRPGGGASGDLDAATGGDVTASSWPSPSPARARARAPPPPSLRVAARDEGEGSLSRSGSPAATSPARAPAAAHPSPTAFVNALLGRDRTSAAVPPEGRARARLQAPRHLADPQGAKHLARQRTRRTNAASGILSDRVVSEMRARAADAAEKMKRSAAPVLISGSPPPRSAFERWAPEEDDERTRRRRRPSSSPPPPSLGFGDPFNEPSSRFDARDGMHVDSRSWSPPRAPTTIAPSGRAFDAWEGERTPPRRRDFFRDDPPPNVRDVGVLAARELRGGGRGDRDRDRSRRHLAKSRDYYDFSDFDVDEDDFDGDGFIIRRPTTRDVEMYDVDREREEEEEEADRRRRRRRASSGDDGHGDLMFELDMEYAVSPPSGGPGPGPGPGGGGRVWGGGSPVRLRPTPASPSRPPFGARRARVDRERW
ncbi:uncharacterized protein MICPUCDRAFT_57605 [Micromonas pusilla CCMP1545]|uniref:Predicted protein n=1 Tax=Micromonas pusilla (strain CCMP1545) TaxID=564608 RepID=C1MRC5_MICPC|nr:uncharacterized protein MICPUCDRAFT_57605 [Micromonas pusilla CCMP1545]EEH58233.1 predicted protein [Micromonas pusilla CCMP1545]|eukprot:XP_003058282.1 predicted protein [Micromonas pusilla CCMP1545]